eukprot:325467_1
MYMKWYIIHFHLERERIDNAYYSTVFFIVYTFIEIPRSLICTFIFTAILQLLIWFSSGFGNYFMLLFLNMFTGSSLGYYLVCMQIHLLKLHNIYLLHYYQ